MKIKKENKLFIILLIIFLAFCAKPTVYHGKEIGGGLNLLSIQDEIALGEQAAKEIDKTMPVLRDEKINDYIQSLGYKLAQSSISPQYPYRFKVINDNVINAFALPGGFIYVHRGLLDKIDNESELAGVLSHEIGHVIGRHGAKIWSKMILLSGVAIVATESIPEKHKKWKAVAEIAGGFTLFFTQLKYSRNAEREADFIAVHLMQEAGYHPDGLITLFEKFKAMNKKEPSRFQTFFSTHPSPSERITNTATELKKIPPQPNLIINTENFKLIKEYLAKLPPPPKK